MNARLGSLLLLVAVSMFALGALQGGFGYLVFYPAMSFGLVGAGYLSVGAAVFGKRANGTLAPANIVVLLPYLLYAWAVWHLLRLHLRENAYDELLPDVLIGRRLLPGELPADVERVLDLTCEFVEPREIRDRLGYLCFPILDAAACNPDKLLALLLTIEQKPGRWYIHCAQGRGRTGLVAAALLLHRKAVNTAADAVVAVKTARPGVSLNGTQRECLDAFAAVLPSAPPVAVNAAATDVLPLSHKN